MLNNSVNEFLNAFGAGRSEVSISGISTKKLNYSLKTIQPLSELNTNSKELTFIQTGIASGNGGNGRRATINLGIGHRLLVEDDMTIAGINFFTDYETKSSQKRLSLGLEYQRANFSANINKYHVFSDKKLVNSVKERGMSGYDVKLSGQAPYLPWAKIKGTYYHWDTTAGPNIKGNILGIDIELTPSVSFEFGQENNNTMNAKSYGKLTVKLPLGNKQKFTNFAIASKAFKDSRKMDLGALAWVERSNKIMIERGEGGISFKGLTYKLVASPDTGRVWLDRNLGAIQVATKKDDSAAYGDHYPFSDISGNNDICPAGFGVPTEGELAAETIVPTPISTPTTALSSFLKLPAAGGGKTSDNLAGDVVFLWTKTTVSGKGRYLTIAFSNREFSTSNSSTSGFKFSVRCIKTRTPIVFNGLTYEMVTSPKTGRVWLDRNLGATKVADSGTDSAAYGDYYQWGRAKDGHSSSTSSGTQTQSSGIVSGQGHFIYGWADWTTADSSGALRIAAWADGGKNDICPAGFSVPTEAELKKELKKANSAVYSVSDAASSFLRIPAAGFRDSSASSAFKNKDADVALWVRTTTGRQGRSRKFSIIKKQGVTAGLTIGDAQRTLGLSVRCVRDRI